MYSKSTATYDYDTVSVYTVTVRCDDGDDTVDGVLTINLVRNEVNLYMICIRGGSRI